MKNGCLVATALALSCLLFAEEAEAARKTIIGCTSDGHAVRAFVDVPARDAAAISDAYRNVTRQYPKSAFANDSRRTEMFDKWIAASGGKMKDAYWVTGIQNPQFNRFAHVNKQYCGQ